MKAWHQLDVRVARYHFESCDNAKFLGAMERYCHAVYLEVENLSSSIALIDFTIGSKRYENSPEETDQSCQDDF